MIICNSDRKVIKEEEAKRKEESRIKEKTPERQKPKAVKRKNSKEENAFALDKNELRKKYEQLDRGEREESSASTPTSSSSSSSPPSSSSAATQKSSGHNYSRQASPSATATSSLHHSHHYGKYVPDGYLINEHGILMTHDFVQTPTASIPTSSVVTASNGHHIEDYADIKIEEFNETDLRLTSEEMSQWQDDCYDVYLIFSYGEKSDLYTEPFEG
uniref:Uncharacterized protein n=1 Tax=Glossina pallidipes TaxID=7398 RepID=A0A1B0A2Z7_GLOPL